MTNWFETLNSSLQSENLLESWDIWFTPISYGETRRYVWQDGSKNGRLISITRENDGRYERPVHYAI